jgi:hypothetical protein
MTLIFFRTIITIFDIALIILLKGWGPTDIKRYWWSQFSMFRSWISIGFYLDLVVLILLGYHQPEMVNYFLDLVLPPQNGSAGLIFASNIKTLEAFKKLLEKQKNLITGLSSVKGGVGLVKFLLRVARLIRAKAPSKGL